MQLIEALQNAREFLQHHGYGPGGDIHDDLNKAICRLLNDHAAIASEDLTTVTGAGRLFNKGVLVSDLDGPTYCSECGAEIDDEDGICGCDVDGNHADDGEDRDGNPLQGGH